MINTISITELKQNTATVIGNVKGKRPIVVMQRSKVAAILVDPDEFRKMEEALEDADDIRVIHERINEPRIPFDEYFKKRFEKSLKK